jgi:uncharacterized membrane protein
MTGATIGLNRDCAMQDIYLYNWHDAIAFILFAVFWLGYALATDGRFIKRPSLNVLMNLERENWMKVMTSRELRVIDTSVIAGLQQGTAFFASTSVFAIGGCFALMNASDQVIAISSHLPVMIPSSRAMFEFKTMVLLLIYAYAFFKFSWSYRLQNYCSILIGAVPFIADNAPVTPQAVAAGKKALSFNLLAGRHYNAGLRAIFLSIGLMGWYAGPYVFMASTLFIMSVLIRRQYFSRARAALLGTDNGK